MMKKIYALTLIETLIAILVFWIRILVVLQWLSQTLRNQEYANMQIKSAFLAREWIELMFNLRDANYRKELEWNCIFQPNEWEITLTEDNNWNEKNPFCNWYFEPWKILKLSIWGENEGFIKVESNDKSEDKSEDNFDNLFKEYSSYKHINDNTFVYNHTEWENSNGESDDWTRFARYIEIKSVNIGDDADIDDKLLKIESHVLYKKWAMTGEKVMETFIGNYEF